jgi:hypothetical protein
LLRAHAGTIRHGAEALEEFVILAFLVVVLLVRPALALRVEGADVDDGRPGALEASLREAGVDGFVFLGGDVVATLTEILGARS